MGIQRKNLPEKSISQAIRIFITSNQAMFREALRNLLDPEPDLCVVGDGVYGRGMLEQVNRLKPDIMLLDMAAPDLCGMEVLRTLSVDSEYGRAIVLVGPAEERHIIEALKLGARGVLQKRTTTKLLFKSIRTVAAGQYWVGRDRISDLIDCLRDAAAAEYERVRSNGFRLTPRQSDIVASVVDGCTNREIAQKFAISEQTVKHHLTNIFEKTGVSNRLELALLAMRQQPEPEL